MSHSNALLRSRKKKAWACIQENRLQEAKTLLQEVCRSGGRDAEAWCLLGAVNGQLGLFDESIAACQKAAELDPDYTDAYYNLAQALMHQGRLEDAAAAYRQVVRLRPDHMDAQRNLGFALESLGRHDDAIRQYQHVLRIQPSHVDTYLNLGDCFKKIGMVDDAIECFRQAVRFRPNDLKAQTNLGFALIHIGKLKEAMSAFTGIQIQDPGNLDAVLGMAAVHEVQGEYESSYALLRPFLDNGVEDGRVAVMYAKIARHIGHHAKAIDLLERILARDDVDSARAQPLHFQLGALYDAIKQYDLAFTHFQQANTGRQVYHDHQEHLRLMDRQMAVFTPEFFARTPRASNVSERPLFIVGMPRSGTSLAEQILASHPSVYGAGELRDINLIEDGFPALLGTHQPYPECLSGVTQAALDKAARRYLDKLQDLSPDAVRVVDKMPHNFHRLGLIAQLFPKARVIHCRRHPLDTCLSIYTYEFNDAHSYATDLRHLGEHYRKYQQLMAHWKTALPLPMMEVQYEEMVANPEKMIRDLIAFCGLEWDDRCLRFYETKRIVSTISYDQVRRPIYTKSVARWKHYERFLGPLKEILDIG